MVGFGDTQARWRAGAWGWLAALAVAGLVIMCSPARAVAQEEEKAAEPPAAQEAAPPAAQPEQAPAPRQSMLRWIWRALGIRYTTAFFTLSFVFVAVLVMNLLAIRQDAICPQHLAAAFEANLNEKKFQEAFELAKADESMLGQMLAAGMQNLQNGYAKAVEAMGQVGEDENLRLEQRLSYISLIGTISPMVGLLGTVDGMVQSFQVIALAGTTPKASELAEGISMALITTLIGLTLAIPAIIAFNLLKNRLTRLVLEVGLQADELMSRFENVGKK
jgi:biopolymer transport protein ExbB